VASELGVSVDDLAAMLKDDREDLDGRDAAAGPEEVAAEATGATEGTHCRRRSSTCGSRRFWSCTNSSTAGSSTALPAKDEEVPQQHVQPGAEIGRPAALCLAPVQQAAVQGQELLVSDVSGPDLVNRTHNRFRSG
jgi:hypothetical protein